MSTAPGALASRKCRQLDQCAKALDATAAGRLLSALDGWEHVDGTIAKTFAFPDYAQTIAFASAVALIAQREDHHPDLTVGHDRCRVAYTTHVAHGLTENDFICAAKIDVLYAL